MLQITDLTLRIVGRPLIEGASLMLPQGSKAGLVGRNGSGKTTLFRAIAGDISPDAGSISLPKGTRIGRVEQEAPSGPRTLLETVLAADTERAALLDEAEHATDPHRIADIHMRLADIGAHEAEARAARILAGLGFEAEAQARPVLGFLRRLADAGGARGDPLLRAGPAPARRANQLPRPRRHAVARAISRALPAHGGRHQPRPRPAEHGGRFHRAPERQAADLLARRLRLLRAPVPRAADPAGQTPGEAGGRAQAHAGVRRPLPRQGFQGTAGAIAAEGDRAARADRRDYRRQRAAVRLPEPGTEGRAADRADGRACRSATSQVGRCCRG